VTTVTCQKFQRERAPELISINYFAYCCSGHIIQISISV